MMANRKIDTWLAEYAESHQHPLNQKLHKICVPAIFWSIAVLLWALPRPLFADVELNWAVLVYGGVLLVYTLLSLRDLISIFVLTLLCLGSAWGMQKMNWPIAWIGGAVFVLAWIGQFYGHKVEGRRPAFFKDLTFLLIGPVWVIRGHR